MNATSKFYRLAAAAMIICLLLTLFPVCASAAGTDKLTTMHTTVSPSVTVYDADEGITDSYGNEYLGNIVRFDASESGYAVYDINGAYGRFTGSIVASTKTNSGAKMNVGIFVDGVEKFSLTGFTRQQAAVPVDIDLTGARTLEIKTSNDGDYSYGWLFFVNTTVEKFDTPKAYTDWNRLREQVVIDSSGYADYNTLSIDSFGKLHSGTERFDASNNAYVLYNLNKNFVTLKGSVVAFPRTNNDASLSLKIYRDNETTPVFNVTNFTKSTKITPFTIDVTNVQVLKIETSNSGSYSNGLIYIVDDILSAHQHTLGDWVIDKEATCTEVGQKTQKCTACGEVVSTEEIAATGHTSSEQWEIITEATCTAEGERIQKCTVCAEVAAQEVIAATGHTTNGTWIIQSEPTCTAEGVEAMVCSVCSEAAEVRSIEMIPHTPGEEWETTLEATCSYKGSQARKCTECGAVVETQELEMKEHSFGKWTKLSGSAWNPPVVRERWCEVCNSRDYRESNATSWLKPLVFILVFLAVGSVAVIGVTLHMNNLPLHPSSLPQLFNWATLSDIDIESILRKPDPGAGDDDGA